MGFRPPSVHACLCHLYRGHATSGQETRRPGQLPLCPSWGQRSPPATLGEWTLAPSAGRKRRQTRGQTGERLSYGRSGCSLVGRRVGRWGRSLWSLANAGAYCRGFSRADPDSSSGEAGRNGRAGRDHALPGHPPLPEFPELWAGFSGAAAGPHSASLGTSEASARQMGHVRLAFNHLSTHLVWNSWLQGRTRSSCRASKSLKQTTHSVCSDW